MQVPTISLSGPRTTDLVLCRPAQPGLLSDPAGEAPGQCDTSVFKRKLIANFGQSVHLSCRCCGCAVPYNPVLYFPCSLGAGEAGAEWLHYSKTRGRYTVTSRPEKHVLTSEHGLVVIAVGEADSGRYDCLHNGQLVSSFHIAVDAHRCSAPNKTADYQKIYSDW